MTTGRGELAQGGHTRSKDENRTAVPFLRAGGRVDGARRGPGLWRRRFETSDDAGRDRRAHRSGTRLPTSRSAHAGPPLRSPRRSLSAAGRGRRHRRPLSPACLMLLTAHPATHTRIIFVGN